MAKNTTTENDCVMYFILTDEGVSYPAPTMEMLALWGKTGDLYVQRTAFGKQEYVGKY